MDLGTTSPVTSVHILTKAISNATRADSPVTICWGVHFVVELNWLLNANILNGTIEFYILGLDTAKWLTIPFNFKVETNFSAAPFYLGT